MPSEYSTLPEARKQQTREACQRYHAKNKESIANRHKAYSERRRRTGEEKEYRKEHEKQLRHRYWAINTIASHRGRGFAVNIQRLQLENLAQKTKACSICGVELEWTNKGKITQRTPSLDRKGNGKELTLENTHIVCHLCNSSKRERTLEEFIDYCKVVASRHSTTLNNGGIA